MRWLKTKKEKLNFFRKLEKNTINIVSTGKDWDLPQSNVITSFNIGKNKNYIINIKKTEIPVFSKNLGTTPQVRPSNIAKREVAELGGEFSTLQDIKSILNKKNLSIERKFITSVKEVYPQIKIAGQYISRSDWK